MNDADRRFAIIRGITLCYSSACLGVALSCCSGDKGSDNVGGVPVEAVRARSGGARYWNPLNAPAWGTDPSHEEPGPLVAAILTFPLDASPLMSGSCTRRDRRRVFPGHKTGIRAIGNSVPQSYDLLTCGFSPV